MATNLAGKRVLITAGPTWVPIDTVRIISNKATGNTGILLAETLAKLGAKVTLLLGPAQKVNADKNIKVIGFKFFDELNSLLKNELRNNAYNVVIHSAAVSDYKPESVSKRKLDSNAKTLSLRLKQTPKLIDYLRKLKPNSFLVGFKFETDLTENKLAAEARSLIKRAQLDLAVANTVTKKGYRAWIVNEREKFGPFSSKIKLAGKLTALIKNAGN